MKKVKKLLVCTFTLCCMCFGCGTKDIASNEAGMITFTPAPTVRNDEITSNDEKLELDHNEKLAYKGYIDRVNDWFGTKYVLSDYDNDGINDRVYKESYYTDENKKKEGLSPDKYKFRIDFGNGDELELGTFDDDFLGIRIFGIDFTNDEKNEIVFLGHHDGMTNASYSEIGVFQKVGTEYKLIPLAFPVIEESDDKYFAGYPIYVKDDTSDEVTLYADYVNFGETIQIERTENNSDERYQDGDVISNCAGM